MGRSPISPPIEIPLDDVAAAVLDGGTVGLGGWVFYNTPTALVRTVIRADKGGVTLIPAPGGIDLTPSGRAPDSS